MRELIARHQGRAEDGSMNAKRLDIAASLSMIVASVVMVGAAAYIVWNRGEVDAGVARDPMRPPRPAEALQQIVGKTVAVPEATVTGSPTASAGLLLYTDMECPFCRRLATEVLPEVRRRYVDTGKAFLGIKHLPIVELHPLAFDLAKAVECGGQQGKAWEVHDAVMATERTLVTGTIPGLVDRVGLLAPDRYLDCLQSDDAASSVSRDITEAQRLGIAGTPMLLFGSRRAGVFTTSSAQPGFVPFAVVAAHLDRTIASSQDQQRP